MIPNVSNAQNPFLLYREIENSKGEKWRKFHYVFISSGVCRNTGAFSDLSYFSFCFPFRRYIMLDLRGLPFQNITSLPGQISAQVPSNISIYGISLIVKRELGPCTLNIRIYQPRETGDKEEMEASMKLRDFGYVGTLPPHEPQPVTLFYDYDYPMLDCPLLMADFSV